MKILYRQKSASHKAFPLKEPALENVCLKEMMQKSDYKITTPKSHWHTEYELHAVVSGTQSYEADGKIFSVGENEFIIIPPHTKHRMVSASENLIKYSVTFSFPEQIPLSLLKIPSEVTASFLFISDEFKKRLPSSQNLIESRTSEALILILRALGFEEKADPSEKEPSDGRLELVKKFIRDNITDNLSAADAASFCHLSPRQLSRLFAECENTSPAKFINSERMKKISECLVRTDLSLKEVSERFSFANEYYFNTAFKRHFGISPSAYRKMFK